MKTPRTVTVNLTALQEKDVPVEGQYVHVRSCTVATFQMAYDADPLQTSYAGGMYPSGAPFSKIRVKDVGAGCTIIMVVADEPFVDAAFDSVVLAAVAASLVSIDGDTTSIQHTVDISDAIETPAAIVALPVDPFLIDNAAAVDKGGGLVGIPVTGQPFATGEDVTIANSINYNNTYAVDGTSTANEVVITETFNAETFDGVDDSIVLATPRSIAANANRKELELHNRDGVHSLDFGDANVDPDNNRGIPIMAGNGEILTNRAQIYFAAVTAAGKPGVTFSYAEHTKT